MNDSHYRSKRSGFTLIELLVVIAIIAVLMAVLMPALQRVKEQAKEITCRSNLKEFGLAMIMYLQDSDSKFPSAWRSLVANEQPVSGYERYCRWHDPRYPADGPFMYYLKNEAIMLCPTFKVWSKSYGASHPNHVSSNPVVPYYSYSMNALLGGRSGSPGWNGPSSYGGGAINTTEVTRSQAEVFLFAEENMWGRFGYVQVLNDNALCGIGTDWFGTYHGTSAANLNAGSVNVVFVDGHVGNVFSALTPNGASDTSQMEYGHFEKYCWPHKSSKKPVGL